MAGEGTKKTRHANGLRVGTRCETIGEFVEKFHRFCEDSVVFVPYANRNVGVDCAFSFDLADGTSALCGLGTVLDHFTTPNNRFRRPGIVIGITRLQASCQRVLDDMIVARALVIDRDHAAAPEPVPTPPDRARDPGRATPVPVRMARGVTSAIEVIDSAAVRAPTRTAAMPVITIPAVVPAPRARTAGSKVTPVPMAAGSLETSRRTPPHAVMALTSVKIPPKVTLASSSSAMAPANVALASSSSAMAPATTTPPAEAATTPSTARAASVGARRRHRWLAIGAVVVASLALALSRWPRSRAAADDVASPPPAPATMPTTPASSITPAPKASPAPNAPPAITAKPPITAKPIVRRPVVRAVVKQAPVKTTAKKPRKGGCSSLDCL